MSETAYKTRSEINAELRKHMGFFIEIIKGWRWDMEDQGKPHSFADFYRAHGACPQCGGQRTLYFRKLDGREVIEPCSICREGA